MPTELDPVIDNWYYHLDKGQTFRVIAVDDDTQTVEIQYFDGDVEEMEFTDWLDLDIELSEQPENWTGAMDIGEADDLGTEITDTTDEDWNEPLTVFHQPDQEHLDAEAQGAGTYNPNPEDLPVERKDETKRKPR